MRFSLFLAASFCFLFSSSGEDRYSWLRDKPLPKTRVVSSKQTTTTVRQAPTSVWTVSSKDSRRKTMTISNRKPPAEKAEPKPVEKAKVETKEAATDKAAAS